MADPRDPGYDSQDEKNGQVVFKSKAYAEEELLREFFVHGEVPELETELRQARLSLTRFVRVALTMAMERNAFERELVSLSFLQLLRDEIVTQKELVDGFQEALDLVEEIECDFPEAVDVLAKFLARAIHDEVLPPKALDDFVCGVEQHRARLCLNRARGIFTEHGSGHRLDHIWGPADFRSVKRMKQATELALREYLEETEGDRAEVDRSIRELNAPSFYFHVVKIALELTFLSVPDVAVGKQRVVQVVDLISHLCDTGLLAKDHVAKGLKIVEDRLDDYKRDSPFAETIVEQARSQLQAADLV